MLTKFSIFQSTPDNSASKYKKKPHFYFTYTQIFNSLSIIHHKKTFYYYPVLSIHKYKYTYPCV